MPDEAPQSPLLPQLRSILGRGPMGIPLLEGANRILEAALVAADEEELGEACLAVVEELTQSEFGFIGVLAQDGTLYDVAISNPGWDACEMYDQTGHRKPPTQFRIAGLYGHVLTSGASLRSNRPAAEEVSVGTPSGHPPLKSFLGTPLTIGGETIGIVALANRRGGYRKEDARTVELLAPAMATALRSKRTAAELARSSQLLNAHIANSPLAVIEFDPSFRVTRWSDEAQRIFGWTAEEVIGKEIATLRWVHEEDTPTVERATAGFLDGTTPRTRSTNRNYRSDGSVIWCEWYSSAIYDSEGQLTSVMSQVLDITDRLRAQQAEQLELNRTRVLLEAAAALASGTSLDDVLDRLCAQVVEAVGPYRVTVALWDPAATQLRIAASRGEPPLPLDLAVDFDALSPSAKEALRSKTTRVVDVDSLSPGARRFGDSVDTHLVLDVPLLYGDVLVGLLALDDPGQRRVFTADEVAIVEGIASQAAVAIENARIVAYEREQARLTSKLTDIEEQLHSSLDAQILIQQALSEGVEALGADTGALSRLEGDVFHVLYSVGFDIPVTGTSIPKEQEAHSLLAIESRRPVVIEDSQTDERVDSEHLAAYGVFAVIVVPLIVAGEVQGNLYFNFRQPHHFSPVDIRFARRLASSLAPAIENARLFEVERSSARINEALARIDQSIHSTLDRDEILKRVAEESAQAIGADSTVLCILEGDSWVVRYGYNMPEEVIGQSFTVEQAPFMEVAAETQRPVAIDDAFNDPLAVLETQQMLGVRAVMMAALIVRDEPIGGLFFNYRDTHQFSPQEIAYASQLALSVGLAIENGRLYEAQRDIADRLQQALLTLPDHLPGIEFGHSYHSATISTQVGGDFYDVFDLDHDRVGITIGDVAGKGLDAAVLTSLTKNTIRAHATEGGKSPNQILALTNEVVLRATPAESFVTVFFGILDCRDGRFAYANAGHPPAAVMREDGTVIKLEATAPLLGALAGLEFEQCEVSLGVGDLLFLYTDGLTEARRDHEFYGETRLLESLSAAAARPAADAVIDRVLADVMSFAREGLRDDLAVLALKRVGPAAEQGARHAEQ